MRIVDYRHIRGTELRDGYIAIPELHRFKPSAKQFIELTNLKIKLTKPTAFLYIEGYSIAQSESGLHPVTIRNYMPALKAGSSYVAHEWIHSFQNREHLVKVEMLSGTCAAGLQAIYEAHRLLNEGTVEEVIIIGAERNTPDTLRLFKELGIDITCGDGFAYMRLDGDSSGCQIFNPVWKFAYNDNPFKFTKETLDTLAPSYKVDYVKLHATGTESNTSAESGLAKLGKNISYKCDTGHTQGVSALLETCMMLDDYNIQGRVLVTANGAGGFYGAFTVLK